MISAVAQNIFGAFNATLLQLGFPAAFLAPFAPPSPTPPGPGPELISPTGPPPLPDVFTGSPLDHPRPPLSELLLHWAQSFANSPWILLILIGFCVIDGFFPPFPSETLIIALASLAQHGDAISPWWVWLAGSVGAFIGDVIAFHIGRAIPVQRLRFMNTEKGLRLYDWAAVTLHKRGSMLIFSARFIPVGRVAVNISAGATGFERARFIRTDAMAVVAWAGYGILIGSLAGRALRHVNPFWGVAVGIAGGLVLGVIMDKLFGYIHHRLGIAPDQVLAKRGKGRKKKSQQTQNAGPAAEAPETPDSPEETQETPEAPRVEGTEASSANG